MFLSTPSPVYKESFLKAAKGIIAEGNGSFLKTEFDENDFEAYCSKLIGFAKGIAQPKDYAHDTILWLIDNNQFVGEVSIRHWLTVHLLNVGGHIGYIIAPVHRKKGYGTQILKLALPVAAELGIKKVLVTCDNTNKASAKIIERNGGVFENEFYYQQASVTKRRYWITLKDENS